MYFNGIPFWSVGDPTLPNPLCPFYIEAVGGDAQVKISHNTNVPSFTLEYSSDLNNWTSITIEDSTTTICNIPSGGKMFFRADTDRWSTNWSENTTFNVITDGVYDVAGNICSLLYGSNFNGQREIKAAVKYSLCGIFQNETKIRSAENLIFPTTVYKTSRSNGQVFQRMFWHSSLVYAPKSLPAMELCSYAYCDMFMECSSLITVPELPATTLAEYCYWNMFKKCTSLNTVPTLPATTLTNRCYDSMFNSCSALTMAPELPATTLANQCYYGMFENCTGMQGSIYLPAKTLVSACYGAMFSNCGLTEIISLAVDGFTKGNNPSDPLWCFMYNTNHPGVLYKDPECDVLNWTSSNQSGVRSDKGWTVVDYQG